MAKLIIQKGASAMLEVSNENINALAIKLNTDGGLPLSSVDNFKLKLSLKKGGKLIKVLFDDTLYTLMNINKSRFDRLNDILVNENLMFFPFETTLNLTNGSTLLIEATNNQFSGTATTSEVIIEGVHSIGVMKFVPVIERIQLDANLLEHNLQLGSHVSRVVYSGSLNDQELEHVKVKSDKIDAEFTPNMLISQLQGSLPSTATAMSYPFNLVNDKHLQNNLIMKSPISKVDSISRLVKLPTKNSSLAFSSIFLM